MARMALFMYCSGGNTWGGGVKKAHPYSHSKSRYLQMGTETTEHHCKMLELSQSLTDDQNGNLDQKLGAEESHSITQRQETLSAPSPSPPPAPPPYSCHIQLVSLIPVRHNQLL